MNEGNQGSGEATGLPRLRGQPRGCRGKRMHLEGGGEPGQSECHWSCRKTREASSGEPGITGLPGCTAGAGEHDGMT